MKGVYGATPWVPKAKVQRMEVGGLLSSLYAKYHLSVPPPASGTERGGDPNVSVSLTVVGLRCSLTCRLSGYHGVGHGCGLGSSLPCRPPVSFKGTMARASTAYKKKQNQNIHLKRDLFRLKNKKAQKSTWDTKYH